MENDRVDGQLALSRAIGDWNYKLNGKLKPLEQKVIAVPEISRALARKGDSLFICCDGLFEKLSVEVRLAPSFCCFILCLFHMFDSSRVRLFVVFLPSISLCIVIDSVICLLLPLPFFCSLSLLNRVPFKVF